MIQFFEFLFIIFLFQSLIFNKFSNKFVINSFIENYIILINKSNLNLYIYYYDFKLLLYITSEYKIIIQSNNLKGYLFKYLKSYLIKKRNTINKRLINLFKFFNYNNLSYLIFLINSFIANKIYFFIFLKLFINNYYKYIIYKYIVQSEQNIKHYILSNHLKINIKISFLEIKNQYLKNHKFHFEIYLKKKQI